MFGMFKKYEIVDDEHDSSKAFVRLKRCKYAGVEYEYNGVRLLEAKDRTHAKCEFGYTILNNPRQVNTDSQEFIDFIGDILTRMMKRNGKDGVKG